MPPTKRLRRQGGFTLIEAMTASVILCFCVIGLASAMTSASQQAIATAAKSDAMNASSAGMELLAAHPLSDLYSVSGGAVQSVPSSSFASHSGVSTSGQITFISRSSKQGSRDLAIEQVQSTSSQGASVTLYRLVSKEGNGQ